MAYVPEFENDIFVSYAVVDDSKPYGVSTGWVTAFVNSLEVELCKQIGRIGRLEPWWDRTDLKRNEPLSDQIRQALESTACLIVVLTPGFLESPWCPKELDTFRTNVSRQVRSNSRIFVVDQGKVPDKLRIQMFPDYQRFEFFFRDELKKPRLLGFPEPDPRREPEYYDAINDLAERLKCELDEIRKAAGGTEDSDVPRLVPGDVPEQKSPRRTVFLADVSDDLTHDRRQLQKYLEDNGLAVVCGGRGEVTREAWQTAATRELDHADCFVQLIGQFPGRELDDASEGIVLLQHQLAESLNKLSLLWRAPDLLQKPIPDQALRQLAGSAGVIECPLEQFKAEAKRFATPPLPPKTPAAKPPTNGNLIWPTVFIQSGIEDIDQAEMLSDVLSEMNCLTQIPLTSGTPDAVREDLEANLTDCDGLIFFYGRITPHWVRAQFRNLPRILPRRLRQDPPRPLKALAICAGEPSEKPNPGVRAPGMQWIDLSEDAYREQLSRWVATLSNGGAE